MGFPLGEYNKLIRSDSNVWVLDASNNLDYSDGDAPEEYLKEVIENAQDLSAQSVELEEKIVDWVSEYHLSSQRTNLLRGLDLEGVQKVLELGSGCGAITRYLGESGINVDAVEGNFRRAEITRLRCRDFENVTVINANFNDLIIPKGTYDAVFLIGVLEYAKRFFPTDGDDRDAVVKVLSLAKSALGKKGVLFIAIENRLGLKYWMGASEDHYGLPYVGLYGYPRNQGIRTYDKREWEDILEKAGIRCYRFCYPFPDYKLPRLILSDNFIRNDPYAYSVLYRITSRDHIKEWQPNFDEFLIWESLHQSGNLEYFSNSFFIIISESAEKLNSIIPFDFVYFSDVGRKPIYRTITIKPLNKDSIIKEKIADIEWEKCEGFIRQNITGREYIKGPLLSSTWIHALVSSEDAVTFKSLIKDYYSFLLNCFNKQIEPFAPLDLLPSNIIIDSSGSYKLIDNEWIVDTEISPDYVLFRALLWLAHHNKRLLARFCEIEEVTNIKEFIEYGFNLLNIELKSRLEAFTELEELVHEKIAFQKEPNFIKGLILESLQHDDSGLRLTTFSAELFWAEKNEGFSENNKISVIAALGPERQVLNFKLPTSMSSISRLRIDPADRPGFFHLFTILMRWSESNGVREEVLWQMQGAQEIARKSQMEGIHFCKAALGEVFLSTSDDPQMIFELPETVTVDAREGSLQVEVEIDWPKSADYLIARDSLAKEIALQKHQIQEQVQQIQAKDGVIQEQVQQIQAKDGVIQEQVQQIQARDGVIQARDGVIQAKDSHIHNIESELNLIKTSKAWRLAEYFRRLLYLKLLGGFPSLQRQALNISKGGFRHFFGIAWGKLTGKKDVTALMLQESDYSKWMKKNELTGEKIEKIKEEIAQFEYNPKISIIMPVYDVDQIWLEKAIDSVINQLYENWELCIADDASTKNHIRKTLGTYSRRDRRIKVKYLEENHGISEASNQALSLATGEFIGLLDDDDELSIDALFENVKLLNKNPEADLIYSDEDKIETAGNRIEPLFKPDYSQDMLLSMNYICHFTLFRRQIIIEIGGFRKGLEGSQDYDLILRYIDRTKTDRILHIPKVLYHWRKVPGSLAAEAEAKNYSVISAKRALSDYLKRNKIQAMVMDGHLTGCYRVKRSINENYSITIIIPFKDEVKVLKRCVRSIIEKTSYQNYKIMLVNNNSKSEESLRYLDEIKANSIISIFNYKKIFNFSEINNFAVSKAPSEYIVLLNNDTEVISAEWLEAMLEFCQREDVGTVGALLYYPNNTIQHGGIIVGLGGVAGHSHKFFNRDSLGYFGRLKTIHNLSAVTAACLMTKKRIYNEVGGFDEYYSHAFNDVDFCLKVREKGYLIVYTPYAELYHHESLSRGSEDTMEKQERFKKEIEYFQKKWKQVLAKGDPYYNCNLTLAREDFSIRI